ncbi:glucose-repressible alcohol dehydrogenase transcriptional effector [Coprinopsis cinerea AmutBmut pab1-1]|nr:glucose-repressible alcohol dehydrogenase transcriptional effector [Coprinopsis cinerea AmutBmut pab1-1]
MRPPNPSSIPQASSPATLPVDSSPCSSPGLEPLILDDDHDIPSIHPLAASYKRTNAPRDPATEDDRVVKRARLGGQSLEKKLSEYLEDEVWADASVPALEEGLRIFHLENKGLTRIDTTFLRDLRKIVVLPTADDKQTNGPPVKSFQRVPTTPAIAAQQVRRTFSRTESIRTIVPGERDDNIHIYLARNMITKVPRELFLLTNLVTLSLRNNRIEYLPPEIALLTQLRDLNVAVNRLTYLPCELDRLPLKTLHVHPNPFEEKPEPKRATATESKFDVPPLVEIACRILVSPPQPSFLEQFDTEGPPRETLLNCYLPVSPPVARSLEACLPGCDLQSEPTEYDTMRITGMHKCPNPSHPPLEAPRYFVRPAEERMSWETHLAGLDVGGEVPVLWRGCSRGCLSFLDVEEIKEDKEKPAIPVDFEPVASTGNTAALDFDDE